MAVTKYEVELVIKGVRKQLGFSARKTRAVLIDYARKHADEILPHVSDDDRWSYKDGSFQLNSFTAVRFSGRTLGDYQRAAALGREVV